jgi:hypothetical protein
VCMFVWWLVPFSYVFVCVCVCVDVWSSGPKRATIGHWAVPGGRTTTRD